LEREIQSKTCWNVPTKVYFTAIQINKSEKPAFVGTLELRNEKQPPPQPKIFFQAVLICWNEKINQNHVGIFLYNLILLFFSHINLKNLLLLESWDCGTKKQPPTLSKFFFKQFIFVGTKKSIKTMLGYSYTTLFFCFSTT